MLWETRSLHTHSIFPTKKKTQLNDTNQKTYTDYRVLKIYRQNEMFEMKRIIANCYGVCSYIMFNVQLNIKLYMLDLYVY